MARIRTLKPSTWTDPELVSLPFEARLFFIGTWTFADDYGVLKDEPERLKLEIMPADPVDAGAIVDQLVDARLLLRRIAPDGTRVLVIRTFCVHQKIDTRKKGRWGHPDEFRSADEQPDAQERDLPRPDAPERDDARPSALSSSGLDGTGLDPSPLPPERIDAIYRQAVELAYTAAKDSKSPPRHPLRWKAWKLDQLREEHSQRLEELLTNFARAPDGVLAAALLGDTHSLGHYRTGGAS